MGNKGSLLCWQEITTYPSMNPFLSINLVTLRPVLTIKPHICLGPLVVSFFQVSPPKFCLHFCSSPMITTCSVYLLILYLITLIIFYKVYLIMKLFIMKFLQSPVTSTLLHRTVFLSTLLLKTLSLSSFLSVRDQVSHPYKIKGKILCLYILSLCL